MNASRRVFLASSAAAAIGAGAISDALAQKPQSNIATSERGLQRELRGVYSQAAELNLLGAQTTAGGAKGPLDLAEIVDQALAKGPDDEDAANLALRAGLLLSELTRNQRDGLEFIRTDAIPTSLQYPYNEALKKEYKDLFERSTIRASASSELTRAAKFITSALPKGRYKAVETDTSVPWYVVGALHYREANLNFMGHLHNGDPLLLQTVHVPAKRPPKPWPPSRVSDPQALWRVSANDALSGLSKLVSNWTVQRMCYGFEAYNGFGCRSHGIKSPYLWNYTNWYFQGGFSRDHFFDPGYRSKQAGVVAIIKKLHELDPDGVQFRFDP